jgi:hypothetical protein
MSMAPINIQIKTTGITQVKSNLQSSIQALRNMGVIREPTLAEQLYAAVDDYFGAYMNCSSESYVLHHEYGWSPREIAKLRGPLLSIHPVRELAPAEAALEDIYHSSTLQVLYELDTEMEDWFSQRRLDSQRVYQFFYFLEIERSHREQALTHVAEIWELMDAETDAGFAQAIADLLNWNAHQLLELRMLARESRV